MVVALRNIEKVVFSLIFGRGSLGRVVELRKTNYL